MVSCRAGLVGAALLCVTSGASAQSSQDQALTLFKEARVLVDAGKHAEACPKLEESQRLDPGVGTQFNLADCYEHTRRPASAWRLFRDVARAAHAAGKTEREKAAQQRVDLLAPLLPFLRITILDAGPVEVRVDGRLVDAKERSQPIAIDPGTHAVEASAPRKRPSLATATVGDRGVVEIKVPALVDLEPERNAVVPPSEGWPAQRTIGVVTAAAGLVGLGVGSALALVARGKRNDLRDRCANYPSCPPDELPVARTIDADGRSAATAATITLIAGAAVLGTGVVLVLLAPSPRPATVASIRVAPNAGGVTFEGTW